MKLLPQTKNNIEEMVSAGFPLCLSKGDWGGKHARHCNSCIRSYRKIT